MRETQIFNIQNVSFNAIHENKILTKLSEFTVPKSHGKLKYTVFIQLFDFSPYKILDQSYNLNQDDQN